MAILGIGGLGHLAVQYARRMGFHTVAIARGADKAATAKTLGAHRYIDSQAEDPAAALQALGGASVIVATISSPSAMAPLVGGLRPHGSLIVLGVGDEPLAVPVVPLIFGERSIAGSLTGSTLETGRVRPVGASAASLRTDDARQSAVSHGADDDELTGLTSNNPDFQ